MPTKLFNHYDYHHIFRTHAVHNQLIHPVDRSQCLNVLAQAVGGSCHRRVRQWLHVIFGHRSAPAALTTDPPAGQEIELCSEKRSVLRWSEFDTDPQCPAGVCATEMPEMLLRRIIDHRMYGPSKAGHLF